ncbi:MAG TPA: glycosyl hydrolase [Puia sp.]|nr:glycosyl hydrolase [Puia sp.]
MRLSTRLGGFLFLLASYAAPAQPAPDPQVFLHPPDSARPWVFWYWMQAAVSRAGIRADLAAMKHAGIGGAYLMPIQGAANPPVYTPAAEQLSPRWWAMVRYAMQVADSLGLRLAMHDCDGFAVAGGPWITPALSMQKVVWTRTGAEGGRLLDLVLPQPPSLENYYEDIAVLAFPTPADWDDDAKPRVSTSKGEAQYLAEPGNKESFKSDEPCWIQYAYDRPFTCRSIVIHSVNNYQSQRLLVYVSDDGQHFRSLGRLTPPRHGWQDGDADVTHSIGTVTARFFRFIYDKTGSEPGSEDLDAAKWKPSLKLTGIGLSAWPAINQFEGKSGAVWRVSLPSTRDRLPDSLCIDPRRIADLTASVDSHGRLRWNAPPGHWTILRIGHTSTGHVNATGGGGKGLECDKLNPEAVNLQFEHWFGEVFRQVGPELAGRVLKIFHVDSWECGSQNWSPRFALEFRRRRGYDLLDWLPTMTGIPVGSADSSESFLHDVRQTIADMLNDNFYGTMSRLAHAHGCEFSAECVAPTFVSDDLRHYQSTDIPMGEFWLRSPTHDKPSDILDAVSGAHIYGKKVVQAEAFTELREAWDESPAMLKPLQDRNYALGINRLVFHVFVHNPWVRDSPAGEKRGDPGRRPGMTLGGVGTYLQRDQTWWPQAKPWIDYTQRCQWMLQQGHPVTDIAVFTGGELPRRAVLPERLVSTLPGLFGPERIASEKVRLANQGEPVTKSPNGVSHSANMADPGDWLDPLHGYAFDSFNPDALIRLATVRDGRVEFPGGASYGLLVFPGATPMDPDPGAVSPALARRLLELVRAGATVLIDPATHYHSNTLEHGPAGDSVVRSVFSRLLRGSDGPAGPGIVQVGKGRVVRGPWHGATLGSLGIAPDFNVHLHAPVFQRSPGGMGGNTAAITYTHRIAGGTDIYFISNQSEYACRVQVLVRITGRVPERWDPLTGAIDTLLDWTVDGGRTKVYCTMAPHGSFFLVFRRPGKPSGRRLPSPFNPPPLKIAGPWTVQFDTAYGGPSAPVRFDTLMDWSRHPDSMIRYYSGPAVYTTTFIWKQTDARALLCLGTLHDMATIEVNGVDCGTLWTPGRPDITRALHPGANRLRIVVTNTWRNRLTGDERLAPENRRTWTAAPFHSDGNLIPAGLLGPVMIRYEEPAAK